MGRLLWDLATLLSIQGVSTNLRNTEADSMHPTYLSIRDVRDFLKGQNDMKVTIDGIQYEGTPDEIRDIVENPPHRRSVNIPDDWPDDGTRNYPRRRGIDMTPTVTWWDNIPTQRNWDGSPRITCAAQYYAY